MPYFLSNIGVTTLKNVRVTAGRVAVTLSNVGAVSVEMVTPTIKGLRLLILVCCLSYDPTCDVRLGIKMSCCAFVMMYGSE